MRYKITIYKADQKFVESYYDTRVELAEAIDALRCVYPQSAGFEYTVSCEVTKRYVLVSAELLPTGDATQQKLWAFVQKYEGK